ncbi:PEGA domain-containing protein [bacterium]|nr:PEGA domain-containing protein [bacterium]
MSTRILFPIRRKMLTYVLVALTLLLCFTVIGVGYSQTPVQGEAEKMKSIQIINPRPPFSLKLWLDKEGRTTYQAGERIEIFFQASQDSFVRIYGYDSEGRVKILFPNQYSPHDFVRAGETKSIEGIIDANTRPGIEYVQGFAITRSISFSPSEKGLISKQFMPEVSPDYKKYTQTIRGIIATIPPTAWTSSNLLSYTVRPIPPPPTNYGRIIAHSKPNGAEAYLDNNYMGTTPINLDRITPGQHRIRFVMAGYQDWSKDVSVSPSRTSTVSANLVPIPEYGRGALSIYCNEDRANIYLNGNYQGRTSARQLVELKNIKQGYYELMITKEGYRDWISTILVISNQTQSVSTYLAPEISQGSITVYCNVSGAKIFVNGTYIAATSSSQAITLEEIKEGLYEITLTNDGYRTWVEEIWVYAGEATPLDVRMNKITMEY